MASNPVIRRFGEGDPNQRPYAPTPSAAELQGMYNQPAYYGPRTGQRYMTLDSVVQRTAAMLFVLLAAGGVAWVAMPDDLAVPALVVSAIGGVGLGLYMSFTGRANAPLALIYAGLEGVLLGMISHTFETRWPGIVVQAVLGTVMVAGGMLFVYKIGAIRVTPRLTRIIVGATLGVFGLMIVNMVAYLFTDGGLGLRSGGPLAIVFSLVCIVIAAFNLVLDFDMIEQGIRRGADEKFAWLAAFGLVVTLVWLYLEILRLLSYLRDN